MPEPSPDTEGYVALSTSSEKPAGERIPATVRIVPFGATLHLADGSRRLVLTVPPGRHDWRFGFFRGSDDALMFSGDWFSASPGDTYSLTLPPEDEPVWVLTR